MQNPRLLPLLLLAIPLAFSSQAASSQTLVVVNQADATINLIDPATTQKRATIPENTPGVHVHEAATSPDGRTAYLPVYGSTGVGKPGIDGHEMLILDIPTHTITGHVDFGHSVRPHLPIFDPNSGLLYVTTELDKSVSIIDPKTLKIIGAVPTGQEQSHMLVLSHDGRLGYTANVGPGTVSVLDMHAKKTLAIIPISAETQRISISNDDKLVFTADQKVPQLAVIDTATNKVRTHVPLPDLGYGTAPTHDGKFLLVAIPAKNAVSVVDLKTMQVTRTIPIGTKPQEILIRPDGKVAYISCTDSANVAAVDMSKPDVANWSVSMIAAGPKADGLAWAK